MTAKPPLPFSEHMKSAFNFTKPTLVVVNASYNAGTKKMRQHWLPSHYYALNIKLALLSQSPNDQEISHKN